MIAKPEIGALPVEAMLADARRLIGPDAELPSYDDLEDVTLRLRGHIQQLIPTIADHTNGRPRGDSLRARAEAGVGEAYRRLDETPGGNLIALVRHGQRLARSVDGLLTHLDNLKGGTS